MSPMNIKNALIEEYGQQIKELYQRVQDQDLPENVIPLNPLEYNNQDDNNFNLDAFNDGLLVLMARAVGDGLKEKDFIRIVRKNYPAIQEELSLCIEHKRFLKAG